MGDCILRKAKTQMSEEAAQLVAQACALKYLEPPPPTITLTPEQVEKLTGRAGFSYNQYEVTLYNGLSDITVTEVDIYLATNSEGKSVERTYRKAVNISPLSTETFRIDILAGDTRAVIAWGIHAVKGHR